MEAAAHSSAFSTLIAMPSQKSQTEILPSSIPKNGMESDVSGKRQDHTSAVELAAEAIERIEQLANTIDQEGLADPSQQSAKPNAATTLSIVIPVYNERESILPIIERVLAIDVDKQLIIVDDGSTDGTVAALENFQREFVTNRDRFQAGPQDAVELFLHASNQGKGSALQTGFRLATGRFVIVQDADFEYEPQDILKVIEPLRRGECDVVYGSRYLLGSQHDSSWIHRLGNAALTLLSNSTTGHRLTDMETCYKAFRREILDEISIEQRRFGFEPEITAKLARRNIEIREVPISYTPRGWSEGKKIGVRDLFNAIYCIFRYSWFR